MLGMPTFDLTTERGKQDFQKWITFSIKNEINSYARQVLNLGLEGGTGGGQPTGPAGGVLSGNYPNPSFAVDMATQAELDNHASDTTNIHGIVDTSDLLTTADLNGVVYQNTPYLDFDTVTPGASGLGQLAWNDTTGTLEFVLKGGNVPLSIGQENVTLVKHADNTGLTKGKVVYVAGSDGTNKTVRYAQANAEATSSKTFGVMAETATGGNKGFVCTQGIVSDINTSTLTEGAAVYVSPTTAGDLTTTKPSAPNHMVLVGFCVRSHAVNGVLYVSVVNGFELQELHNVSINVGTLANGDIIKYNSSTQVWENVAADDIPTHASTHIPGGSDALDLTKIIAVGASLPALPNALYPAGTLFGVGAAPPYLLYRSNGSAWQQIGGAGGGITVSDSAPASPSADDLWYNSLTGRTYIYYDSFWVEVGNSSYDTTLDELLPAGILVPTATSVEPSGWLFCYGQTLNSVSNPLYARLYAAIGTTYGGSSASSFIVPDLRGRIIAGKDNMGGSNANRITSGGSGITGTTLGAAGGTETHTLSEAQMPSHTHIQNSHRHDFDPRAGSGWNSGATQLIINAGSQYWGLRSTANNSDGGTVNGTTYTTATNQNTGGSQAHQNTQPTMILNYIIKL